MTDAPVLMQARDIRRHYPSGGGLFARKGIVKAVDGVSFELRAGETLAVVGESGCGKSTLARVATLIEPPTSGALHIDGAAMADEATRDRLRLSVQMVFQNPFGSLNPRKTIGAILQEPLEINARGSARAREAAARSMMDKVGLRQDQFARYPHMFSGGQRQRIAIARALALEPKIIIADEPVSALDVSIQAQILNLLFQLCRKMNLSLIFIAHDLSVVKHISDRVAVMYLGKIVELGPAADVIDHPRHPYTRALVSAIPTPNPDVERSRQRIVLAGDPPSPINPPAGCAFHPRCPYAQEKCKLAVPPLIADGPNREVACIRLGEI